MMCTFFQNIQSNVTDGFELWRHRGYISTIFCQRSRVYVVSGATAVLSGAIILNYPGLDLPGLDV